jgi:hypothetical protein
MDPYYPPPEHCHGTYNFNYLEGLVRQEGREVFFYDEDDVLLYDFDLQIGDTVPPTYFCFPIYFDVVISDVDSIFMLDSYRKVYTLIGDDPFVAFYNLIEGIGFEGGFLEQCPFFAEFPSHLECYTLNDTTWYPNYGDPCDLDVKILELNKFDEIKIFPNPVFSFLIIEYAPHLTIDEISIYNILGEKIPLKLDNFDGNHMIIDFSSLKKGIYSLQLLRGNRIIKNQKIIKQ